MADFETDLSGSFHGNSRFYRRAVSDDIPSTNLNSPLIEDCSEYKRRWASIRVLYLTMFLSSIGYSMIMPSVWPYLQSLDSDTTAGFLGWVVAAYSIGQLVTSPLLGRWANRYGTLAPLVASTSIIAVSNIVYGYLNAIPAGVKYFMIGARVLTGVGCANVAVTRSFVASATTLKERTATMANVASFQAIGFILGPVLQAAFTPMGATFVSWEPIKLQLNMYTCPAFLSAILAIINVVLLCCLFTEYGVDDDHDSVVIRKDVSYTSGISTASSTDVMVVKVRVDYVAIAVSLIIYFGLLFVFSFFETIITPLSIDMYGWTHTEAVLYCGLMLSWAGFVSVIAYIGIKPLSKRVDERIILIGGLVMMAVSFLLSLPMGDQYPILQAADLTPAINQTAPSVNGTHGPTVGCLLQYLWCRHTPIIHLVQLLVSVTVVSLAYPVCVVILSALYSKILGPAPQGTMQGWLTSAGCCGRIFGPMFVSNVYEWYGPYVALPSVAGIIVVTVMVNVVSFRRLVPYQGGRKMSIINT